ncbi:MAG: tRNA-binding protein [Candidatus Neomarinimicrobiota bacterium]|nr:MAG: tRNA-binding protein [Candidatus Neomarinimicrobiota bacterium]
MITIKDFSRLDIRLGTIVAVDAFPEAKKPAYKLKIDLGPMGVSSSSARITNHYRPEDLLRRQVVCAVNLGPKRIGGFVSEVLVLGIPDENGAVLLLQPDRPLSNGARIS